MHGGQPFLLNKKISFTFSRARNHTCTWHCLFWMTLKPVFYRMELSMYQWYHIPHNKDLTECKHFLQKQKHLVCVPTMLNLKKKKSLIEICISSLNPIVNWYASWSPPPHPPQGLWYKLSFADPCYDKVARNFYFYFLLSRFPFGFFVPFNVL